MMTTTEVQYYSIGQVAQATGLSPDMIRVWERRYQRPVPVRLPSGHRRYTDDHIRWLRRVAEGLAMGLRPAMLVHASDEQLDAILEAHSRSHTETPQPSGLDQFVALARRFDGDGLRREFTNAVRNLGPEEFLGTVVAPLITGVGREWADGSLAIRHEHFLTEILEDVIRDLRVHLPRQSGGPMVVLTTLPGELHSLGLQIVASMALLHGASPVLLGANLPMPEIVEAARTLQPAAVALSVSLASGGASTDRTLSELRVLLPKDIKLIVGGRGARGVRRGIQGVEYIESFDQLRVWLEDLRAVHRSRNGEG